MKTILCLFVLVLVCSQEKIDPDLHSGSWKVQDPQEFMQSPYNQELLEGAKQFFIARAQQVNEISSPQLAVKTVKSVEIQVVSGLNVRFGVDLVDENGKVYDVTFITWSQPWRSGKEVSLLSYIIN